MEVTLGKMFEFLKLGSTTLLGVFIASVLLLFAPDELVKTLGLKDLVFSGRIYIGIACLGSFSLLSARLGGQVGMFLRAKYIAGRKVREFKKKVRDLSREDKELLQNFFINDTRTFFFDVSESAIGNLEALGIVFRSSNVAADYLTFAFTLQPWAWEHFRKNPHLIGWDGKVSDRPVKLADLASNF